MVRVDGDKLKSPTRGRLSLYGLDKYPFYALENLIVRMVYEVAYDK